MEENQDPPDVVTEGLGKSFGAQKVLSGIRIYRGARRDGSDTGPEWNWQEAACC